MLEIARVKLDAHGRIVIPAEFRHALGIKEGDPLLASLEDGEVHIFTRSQGIRRAQALVRKYVPEGVSLVDELIADRHAEVEAEERGE